MVESTRPKAEGKRAATLLIALVAELVNKLSPLIVLHLAQARLGVEAFGAAQAALNFVETLIPIVACGYGTFAALEIGSQRLNGRASGELVAAVILLRSLHFFAVACVVVVSLMLPGDLAEQRWLVLGACVLLVASWLETDYVHFGQQSMLSRNSLAIFAKALGVLGVALFVHDAGDAASYALFAASPAFILAMASAFYNLRRIELVLPNVATLRQLFLRSLPYTTTFVITTLLDRVDAWEVQLILGSSWSGIYLGQLRMVQSILTAAATIGLVFHAELVAITDREAFAKHVGLTLWAMLSLVAPIAAGVFFVDREILALIYGEAFVPYSGVLDALTLGALLQVGTTVFGFYVLQSKGQIALLNGILCVALVVGAGVAWLLGTRYGVVGFALGNVAGKATGLVLSAYAAWRTMGRLPWKECGAVMLPALGMMAVLALADLSGLVSNVALGAAVFSLLFLALNRQKLSVLGRLRAKRR